MMAGDPPAKRPVCTKTSAHPQSSGYDRKALQEKYGTDLAGNPRIVDGKLDIGCFQSK